MDDLRGEILSQVRRTLASELEFPGTVELHHELAADLQVDSIGAFVLAVALEDRFRVKLAGDEASSVVTVEDLVGAVERAVDAVRGERAIGEPGAGDGGAAP